MLAASLPLGRSNRAIPRPEIGIVSEDTAMVWFWSRSGQELHLETTFDNETSEFVLTMVWSDGRRETERFTNLEEFRVRLVATEERLQAERWKNSGPPLFVPEGFPNKRLT